MAGKGLRFVTRTMSMKGMIERVLPMVAARLWGRLLDRHLPALPRPMELRAQVREAQAGHLGLDSS